MFPLKVEIELKHDQTSSNLKHLNGRFVSHA